MNRLSYLVILGILGMLILAMVASIPARADAPVHPVHIKYAWTDDFPVDICDVTMTGHTETKLEYIIYCDRNDTCRGDNYHYNEYFTLTYGDHSFTMRHAGLFGCTWLTVGEPVDEICRESGGMYIGTLPGYGVVSGSAGRTDWYETGCRDVNGEWVCETFEYLHQSGIEFWDLEPICNYMLN